VLARVTLGAGLSASETNALFAEFAGLLYRFISPVSLSSCSKEVRTTPCRNGKDCARACKSERPILAGGALGGALGHSGLDLQSMKRGMFDLSV